MYVMHEIANQRARDNIELAQQLWVGRRLQLLRRADRMEVKAERRMFQAWSRAAKLRGLESLDY
jgi:hypothetical protein